MRIGYVNARYRLDTHDGPNAHSRQFVENTVALGHDVWMWPGQEHPLAQRLPRSRLSRLRVLRTMDVVYVRLEHRPPAPCRWAVGPRRALLGDPLMVWEFNTVPEFGVYTAETPSGIARNIEGFRRFGRGCDLAVCVSSHLAEYVHGRLGIERTLAVPNGSDPELYRPDAPIVRHLRDGDPRTFHVLWIGSAYVPWHDFDLLRNAAEMIWRRGNRHHIAVHLIGKDVRLTGEMPPNVHYHGMEEYQHLPRWMSGMHVGLCLYRPGPADYSSPLKLFDYLSSGLAVVATRQPQTAQILGELGTPDLLIEPHDAEGLASRLEALAGDRERVRQIGRRARELLVSKYTWRATVTTTLAAIERLVSGRAGPARRLDAPTRPPPRRHQPSAPVTPGDPDTGPVPVSVCIATYRRPDSLGRLLEGLTKLDPRTPGFEVVVIDNDAAGSAAPVATAFADRLSLRLAVEPRRSVAHARNLSVALARGEFVAFIDDDEVPDPRWLAELHAAVSATGADGGFGPVEVRFDDDVPPWITRSTFFERAVLATGVTVPWWQARSGNALIRRSSLGTRAQPFDPRFGSTGGEDTDLFYRMIRQGARFIAVESARVVEQRSRHRSSGWWMLRRSFRQGGTIVDVSLRNERAATRLRAWSRAAARVVGEGYRALRHFRARDRSFAHLLNSTQSLGMLAAVFGVRYREYGGPNLTGIGSHCGSMYQRQHSRRVLKALEHDGNHVVRAVAQALQGVLDDGVSTEERAWIGRIERLRAEMNASTESISNIDYGAHAPGDPPSVDKMTRGHVVTRTLGEICLTSSMPHRWALLLLRLVRALQPSTCLELGTCVGISAAYQALALELNQRGRLITLDGAAPLAHIAHRNLDRLGLTRRVTVEVGRFSDTLGAVLREHRPVDLVFIDGHHDEQATRDYFEQVYPHLSPDAVLLFDDIRWSPGMLRAWRTISGDRRHLLSIDLERIGICLVGGNGAPPRGVRMLLV